MTTEEQRLAIIREILAEPHRFICCEACGSFVKKRPAHYSQIYVCPVCHSYGFFDDTDRIKEHARKLALSKPSSIQPHDLK